MVLSKHSLHAVKRILGAYSGSEKLKKKKEKQEEIVDS